MSTGSSSVSNATYLALLIGWTVSSSRASGTPAQGITIDQASTHRIR